MAGRPIRFRPPRVEVPPEVRWMLLRAFGPAGADFPGVIDPAAALAVSRRFEVAARIAARTGRASLSAELGAEGAGAFLREQAAAAALGLRFLALAGEVAALADPLGLPVIFLKFAALEACHLTLPGARGACDLDLLVPEPGAEALQNALKDRGWRPSGMPASEHQLPPIEHPDGGIVELHRRILGVRPGGRRSATADSLARRDLLVPLANLPGRCAAPVREVLAAHALAHGVGQHGWWPASYSPLKMIGDLIDTGFAADHDLAARAVALVTRDVSAAEAGALRALCADLVAGSDPLGPGMDHGSGAALFLRHILAGRTDSEYAAALHLGLFSAQPSDRPPAVRLARTLLHAVFLTRAQVDAIYGPPQGPLGYWGRRLARPFDLVWRLVRYSARLLRLQRNPRRR